MEKILVNIQTEIDILINSEDLARCRAQFARDPNMQKLLEESTRSLECVISSDAALQDTGSGNLISVSEYLKRHPEIIVQSNNREVVRNGLIWQEMVSQSSKMERRYCAQARQIYGGKFGEVFQCILMGKDGQSRKYVAITGKTDCVSASDIEECLPQKEIDIRRDSTSQVILVHNHPDCYRDTRIFEKRSGDVVGFVSNGSLSTLDVGLANSLYTRFRGKVPITMKAINERGLTHSYSGGQSQRYFE